jgi:hypothetical protein
MCLPLLLFRHQDARGKTIVSAANHMVDSMDSMFYNFKKTLGYDLFKK